MSQRKTPPRAEFQPWHAESARAWNEFYTRCQINKAERKRITDKWKARINVANATNETYNRINKKNRHNRRASVGGVGV